MPRTLVDFLPSSSAGLPSHMRRPIFPSTRSHAIINPSSNATQPIHHSTPNVSDETADAMVEMPENSVEPAASPEEYYQTKPNTFGVFRCYTTQLKVEPRDHSTLGDISDAPTFQTSIPRLTLRQQLRDRIGQRLGDIIHRAKRTIKEMPYFPFENATSFLLTNWVSRMKQLELPAKADYQPRSTQAHTRSLRERSIALSRMFLTIHSTIITTRRRST